MAAVLLRAASLAFVMVLGILLKKTGIVGNPARVLRKVCLLYTSEKAEEKNEMLEGCILEMSETVYQ